MKIEYLLFNLVVIIGPLLLSFDKNVHYVEKWPRVFRVILIALIPFAIWDNLVTERHWWFNSQFTLNFQILKLPMEEWLFFVSVPFSSIFVWEVLKFYFKNRKINQFKPNIFIYIFGGIGGLALFLAGKEYTGLVLWAITAIIWLDHFFATRLFTQLRTFQFLALVTGLTLVFNGYLTARPVVLYDLKYQLGWHLGTVPVEDFIFGFSHILLCIILYEKPGKDK